MTKEELAEYLRDFVEYCQRVPNVDELNLAMVETVLGNFAKWLDIQPADQAQGDDDD